MEKCRKNRDATPFGCSNRIPCTWMIRLRRYYSSNSKALCFYSKGLFIFLIEPIINVIDYDKRKRNKNYKRVYKRHMS